MAMSCSQMKLQVASAGSIMQERTAWVYGQVPKKLDSGFTFYLQMNIGQNLYPLNHIRHNHQKINSQCSGVLAGKTEHWRVLQNIRSPRSATGKKIRIQLAQFYINK